MNVEDLNTDIIVLFPAAPKSSKFDYEIQEKVQPLLDEGFLVVFERQHRGVDLKVIKIIDKWEADDLGDLKASYVNETAFTPYICPGDRHYKIYAIKNSKENLDELGVIPVI